MITLTQNPIEIPRRLARLSAGALGNMAKNKGGFDFKLSYAAGINAAPVEHINQETDGRTGPLKAELGATVEMEIEQAKIMAEMVDFDAAMAPKDWIGKRLKEDFKGKAAFLPWVLWMFEEDEAPTLIPTSLSRREVQAAYLACSVIVANEAEEFGFEFVLAAAFNLRELDVFLARTNVLELKLLARFGAKNRKGRIDYIEGKSTFKMDQLPKYQAAHLELMSECVVLPARMAPEETLDELHDANYAGDASFIAPTIDWMYQNVEEWQKEKIKADRKAERETEAAAATAAE